MIRGEPSVTIRAGHTTDPTTRVEVSVDVSEDTVHWQLANNSSSPMPVDAVVLHWDLDARGSVHVATNGYQSWSASPTVLLGDHDDPSRHPDSLELFRAWHHADPGVAQAGEVRSEQLVSVQSADAVLHAAFLGGDRHAGTFRIHRHGDAAELRAEAWLGGVVLAPGESRDLHPVVFDRVSGERTALVDRVGEAARARTSLPFRSGWCSWYQFFTGVTEEDVRRNLALAADWPVDVFQIDDGYQAAIGDWLTTNEKFTTALDGLAADINSAGFTPGIWLAPFLVGPDSATFRAHPEWVARWHDGSPLIAHISEDWGGVAYALDVTHPEVVDHLIGVVGHLVDAGFDYLKLDFTYAAALPGQWHRTDLTPAQRVRTGFETVRRAAGDEVTLLGCGAPLGPCVGVVDAMRIGPDVAPWWEPRPQQAAAPGYEDTIPATSHAVAAVLARSDLHRRWWVNDPDCLLLRPTDTQLSDAEIQRWCSIVAASGEMVVLSDDLALLGADARTTFEHVLETGRAHDRT